MTLHRVRLRLDAVGRGEVLVDDRPVHCTDVSVDASVGDIPRVTLTLLASEVDVEVDAIVDAGKPPETARCPGCGREALRQDGEIRCYFCGTTRAGP